ncbi:MAG TPA: phosphatase PAP2 family protein [Ideonella sp.]|uniref:phosphatase PAP2 family protein n=1 Tax=Ideonella sp. TaxID=1929293 RepID=UPI002E2FE3E4|nr:phosphatase PAP2 family protein [Ideonella sp.]HEX5683700.1 phosphatase PAP2 family protein [Ideonella sp.]
MSDAFEVVSSAISLYPRWGGPGTGQKAISNMLSPVAMASLRVETDSKVPPDDDDPADGLLLNHQAALLATITGLPSKTRTAKKKKAAAPAFAWPAKGLDPRLLRCESFVRESMLADEISDRLTFGALVQPRAALLASAGTSLIELVIPSPDTIARQAQIVRQRATDRNLKLVASSRAVLHLQQLDAQHLDPLHPLAIALGISPETHPRTFEAIAGACSTLAPKLFRMKHSLGVERPHRLEPGIVPMMTVPGHLSYPGGHAAKCFMAALILFVLAAPQSAKPFDLLAILGKIALTVSNNRVKAGLHYPMDTQAGRLLGLATAVWLLSAVDPAFAVTGVRLESDLDAKKKPRYTFTPLKPVTPPDLPLWKQMFLAAAAEWN